ncbi:choline-sulfatase [Desulfohalovibrio reitneri]|uniref:choline-sulfatase n=1 Tax=Desulfohalovibrio reitneri TaxID=1307759 RepID=UPI0004A6C04C|nr:choline-sulfatase [Desulfohalovibrio reitneri]
MAEQRPNILVIQCDQMAASALSCYGNRVSKTPHIDSLSEDGVVFTSAYCNSPLCAPSRFSMMAGQYPSRIGAYDNGAEFPADIPTFAHYLRANGYRTTLCGKMHFVGGDQMHGFEERLTTDVYPADHGWTPDWSRPEHRFDWWYHNMDSVVDAGHNERANQIDFDDEVGFQAERHVYDIARDKDDRPFCMTVSFTNPHDPYICPKEHWDRYDHDEIDMPRVGHIPYDQCDPHSQRLRHAYKMGEGEMDPEDIRNARHAYYGQISYLDDKIGRILKALDDTGMRENTVIILTADHGDMLGEHGLWFKMSLLEDSARVPFVMNGPGLKSGRVAKPVSLVDLMPTMMDLAGAPQLQDPSDNMDGTSLLPLAKGGDDPDRPAVITEYLGEGAVSPMIMIRDDRYKYIHCPVDPPQLFDLQEDPEELDNLACKAEYASMVEEYRARVREHVDLEELDRSVHASQKRRRIVFEAHMTGKHTPWDYHPPCKAANQYMRNHLDLNDVEACSRICGR